MLTALSFGKTYVVTVHTFKTSSRVGTQGLLEAAVRGCSSK